jgi:HSP20 family protein
MALIKSRRAPVRGAFAFPSFTPMPTFGELENRMRKVFEGNFFPVESELFAQPLGFLPPADVAETDEFVTLTLELPGLEKKDVDVNIEDDVLTVRGEKFEEKKDEAKKYYLVERTYGTFQRAFTLPRSVDSGKIWAEFDKGVLTVMLPKTAEAKAKGRKVEIAAK